MTPKGIAYATVLGLGIAGFAVLWAGHLRLEELRAALARSRETRRPIEPARAVTASSIPKKSDEPLKRQTVSAPSKVVSNPVPTPVPLLRVPSTAWNHNGGVTPQLCFESVLRAAIEGDTQRLSRLLTCDATARLALQEVYQYLSEQQRQAYASADEMLAALVAVQIPGDMKAYSVLGEKAVHATETVVAMQMERENRIRPNEAYFVFRREDGAWKLVVPDSVIRSVLRPLAPVPPKAP